MPQVIGDYDNNMGGVDKAYQHVSNYKTEMSPNMDAKVSSLFG
jgi:hypothetical protein